jgi:hypothetical protein
MIWHPIPTLSKHAACLLILHLALTVLQVMGIDKDFASAYAKAQIAAGQKLPTKGGKVFLTMADKFKKAVVPIARDLGNLGFGLVATCEWRTTCRLLFASELLLFTSRL